MNGALLAGIFLGFGGVGLLMGRSALTSGLGVFIGSLAVVLGAFSWAVGVVYSRRSHLSGHPLLLSALSLLAGSLQLLLAGTLVREYRGFTFASVSLRSWLALAYLIVFGSVIAFTAYNWLLEHYSPTLVATHTYINPIVAVLLGWRGYARRSRHRAAARRALTQRRTASGPCWGLGRKPQSVVRFSYLRQERLIWP